MLHININLTISIDLPYRNVEILCFRVSFFEPAMEVILCNGHISLSESKDVLHQPDALCLAPSVPVSSYGRLALCTSSCVSSFGELCDDPQSES